MTIKRFLAVAALIGWFGKDGMSQAAVLTLAGPATAKPGTTINLNLNLSASSALAGVEWSIGLPSGYTATIAPGASAAGKTLTCTADNSTCVLLGVNTASLPVGALAVYSLRVPATAAGKVDIPLSNLEGVTATGSQSTTNPGAPYSFTIPDRRDLNGDGSVTVTDVKAMTDEVIAAVATPAACVDDLNGDGKCSLMDIFQVVLKALGLIP